MVLISRVQNSANIIVQNRLTGQLEEEKMQVYVRLGIRLLYKGWKSRMEGVRGTCRTQSEYCISFFVLTNVSPYSTSAFEVPFNQARIEV